MNANYTFELFPCELLAEKLMGGTGKTYPSLAI